MADQLSISGSSVADYSHARGDAFPAIYPNIPKPSNLYEKASHVFEQTTKIHSPDSRPVSHHKGPGSDQNPVFA